MMSARQRADPDTAMTTSAVMTSTIRVLLVDDEEAFRSATARRLRLRDLEVVEACDGEQAEALLREHRPDVVVCDLKMPRVDGLSLLQRALPHHPATAWLILTGQASVETAVNGLKLGAADYLQKPIDAETLETHIRRVYEQTRSAREVEAARRALQGGVTQFGIVGRSVHVAQTYEFINKAARSDQPVLITGESGTGKELIARGVHECSDRAARPFVTVSCAALSEALLANELFGHVEGAYAGAVGTKQGLFEVADGGTLFIDEIADLSMQNEAAVLRILETGQFRRLGDVRDRVVDVRLAAATVRELPEMVERQAFRGDLYYRLNVLPWRTAPLRDRREDLPLLTQFFIDRHSQRTGRAKGLSPEATVVLQAHDWPGNIRELCNVLERAASLCDQDLIKASDLKLGLSHGVATADGVSNMLDDVEREHIQRVLEAHHGNKLATAKALGISRMKLYRKLERYGMGQGPPTPLSILA